MKISNYIKTKKGFHFFPILLFTLIFCLYFFTDLKYFNTHTYCDNRDGSHTIWSTWWVKHALSQFSNPYFTDAIHYPIGVTLYRHPLVPISGIFYLILSPLFSITFSFNFVILLSFILSGYGAFLLAHFVTRSYFWSIIAGFIFSFSQNHIAHIEGHLQQVIMQWIPFFIYFFLKARINPKLSYQFAAMGFLALNVLTDLYYTMYSCLFCVMVFIYDFIKTKPKKDILRPYIKLIPFIVGSFIIVGTFAYQIHLEGKAHPTFFERISEDWSLDLLAPFIWGESSFWGEYVKGAHRRFPGSPAEKGAYLGWSLILLLIFTFIKRKKRGINRIEENESHFQSSSFIFWIGFIFYVIALGPKLQWSGTPIIPYMPYYFLEKGIFLFRLSNCPIRFIVMVYLFWGLFVAKIMSTTSLDFLKNRKFYIVFSLILLIDYLPKELPKSSMKPHKWMLELRDNKNVKGGLMFDIENFNNYRYQTIYKKPRAFGYFGRVPTVLMKRRERLINEFRNLSSKEEFFSFMQQNKFDFLGMNKMNKQVSRMEDWGLLPDNKDSGYNLYFLK